jgi:hypothetical protein
MPDLVPVILVQYVDYDPVTGEFQNVNTGNTGLFA